MDQSQTSSVQEFVRCSELVQRWIDQDLPLLLDNFAASLPADRGHAEDFLCEIAESERAVAEIIREWEPRIAAVDGSTAELVYLTFSVSGHPFAEEWEHRPFATAHAAASSLLSELHLGIGIQLYREFDPTAPTRDEALQFLRQYWDRATAWLRSVKVDHVVLTQIAARIVRERAKMLESIRAAADIAPGRDENRKRESGSTRQKTTRDVATNERDKWIYEEACSGVAYDEIARRLDRKPREWTRITTKQGIRDRAFVYAKRNGLQPPPSRQEASE